MRLRSIHPIVQIRTFASKRSKLTKEAADHRPRSPRELVEVYETSSSSRRRRCSRKKKHDGALLQIDAAKGLDESVEPTSLTNAVMELMATGLSQAKFDRLM